MKRFILSTAAMILVLMVAAPAFSAEKKVLFIDSYHEGYAWSDGITRGVKSVLEDSGVNLKVIRMDTKRNKSEEFKVAAAEKAKAEIEAFKPDVVIAADDNASKYLIAPYYKGTDLPVVFCGVNWDASGYGFPASNVTGMVEVNDVVGLIGQLKQFAKGDRVGFIAGDAVTNEKEIENYKKKFNLEVDAYLAKDFADWKKGYSEMQTKVDILIVYNFVAVPDWDAEAAKEFILANTKIPTGTMQSGVMDYAMLGFTKVAEEQGEWSAKAALRILNGTSPADIPVARNEQGNLMVNVKIAEAMGAEIPYELLANAQLASN